MSSTKGTKERFVVKCTRPHGVTVKQMQDYIKLAVTMWSRGGNPMDPIWEVGDYPIVVKRVQPDEDIFKVARFTEDATVKH